MPDHVENTRRVLEYVAEELSPDTFVDVVAQYQPYYKADSEEFYEEIGRPITEAEYDEVVEHARAVGLERLYLDRSMLSNRPEIADHFWGTRGRLNGFIRLIWIGGSTMARKRGSVGSAGRFGARYGRVARRRVAEIEDDMHEDHECPDCGTEAVDRGGTGIWECQRCGYKFAGGSYRPETPGGRDVRRSLRAALSEDE